MFINKRITKLVVHLISFYIRIKTQYKMLRVIEINLSMIFMEQDLGHKMYAGFLSTFSNLPSIFVINIFQKMYTFLYTEVLNILRL